MGSMIGSGIFIVSADMSRTVGSPALLIAAWLVTAAMTIIGALSYGELAAMMPKAGGQYVYLREALGPIWGFLYGWTLFLVIQTGTIAAVGVAFGKFLGVFFPSVEPDRTGSSHIGSGNIGLNTANLAAIAIITLLTFTNTLGVKLGAAVRTSSPPQGPRARRSRRWSASSPRTPPRSPPTLAPAGTTSGPERAGTPSTRSRSALLRHRRRAIVGILTVVAVVQVGSLFSSDAWNNVTFTAGEIENPKRNLPLSLALGTGVVLLLYIALQLRLPQRPPHGRRRTRLHRHRPRHPVRHPGPRRHRRHGAGLRRPRRQAHGRRHPDLHLRLRQRHAPRRRARLLRHEPRRPLLPGRRQAQPEDRRPRELASGSSGPGPASSASRGCYGQLLDYVIFAVLIFYILTIVGLFVLRRTQPDAPRPYRAFGYPVLPALYIVMATWICVVLLRYKPQYTWPGLILVLLGVPVYLLWKRMRRTRPGYRTQNHRETSTNGRSVCKEVDGTR